MADLTMAPSELTEERAYKILHALAARLKNAHERAPYRGFSVLRAFCVCGYPSGGPAGPEPCRMYEALLDGKTVVKISDPTPAPAR